mmetsp:Transcript_6954/g.26002  ORF Transcript_6954/g.26002 Transcript_6954/m.26002 type:complete len:124 (-) Transcript_6954:2020-2391(-)
MIVNIHIKEKTIPIQTGPSTQPIQWLSHVALTRYSPTKTNYGLKLGIPRGVQRDNGELLDNEARIGDVVEEGEHLWVVLGDEKILSRLPQKRSTNNTIEDDDEDEYFSAANHIDEDEDNMNNS